MRRLDADELVWVHKRRMLKRQSARLGASNHFLPDAGLQRGLEKKKKNDEM